ncbi:serine/threonine-protein kinase [Streptomyces sp. NPDC006670]|uniref:WD40 repeat domain-containing serine/threonine protein kinase n=1 Tax=Streptomyces sp. NPDC006670 TaxID=3154476 RepID=UPI0033D6C644
MDALLPHDPRWVGPYRLEGRLGEGGMGQVFLGTSPGGRPVAVKLIRAELAGTGQFRERFAREVEAARQVGGFHTAQVVDADPAAESPWLVTAFVPGPTLHRAVAEGGPFEPAAALRLGAGLAEGLAAIHRCGLVHRDLKPGNVIVAEDGPRIIDFGIARAVDASSLTATGSVIGTYAYMSPEQIRADRAGPAGDVFALGAVLAFAATGRGPFDAPSLPGVVQRILGEPPVLDGIDGELRALLTDCLAKDPADRPDVRGLPARFAAAVAQGARAPRPSRERTVVASPAGRTPQPPTEPDRAAGTRPDPRATAAEATSTRRGPSRRALLVAGASAAAVAAAGIPAYLLLRESDAVEGPSSTYQLAFSADGSTLVAAGGDGEIWRWSPPGKKAAVTRISIAPYTQAHVFSRDLGTLYRADEHKILKWDVATGRTVGTFTGETTGQAQDGFIQGLGLSPDGRTLAAGSGRGLYLWDTGTGSRLALHEDVKNGPAAYSADGTMLAAGSPLQLRKGSADTVLATLDAQGATGAVFSPDGQLLAFNGQGVGVRLWNTATRQDVTTLEGHDSPVQAIAFHPDGRTLATGDRDGKVLVWSTTSGTPTSTHEPGASVEALAFSPDGKTLAAGCGSGTSTGGNDTVWLWKPA